LVLFVGCYLEDIIRYEVGSVNTGMRFVRGQDLALWRDKRIMICEGKFKVDDTVLPNRSFDASKVSMPCEN